MSCNACSYLNLYFHICKGFVINKITRSCSYDTSHCDSTPMTPTEREFKDDICWRNHYRSQSYINSVNAPTFTSD